MRCVTCASPIRQIGNQWFCDECSAVQTVIYKSPNRHAVSQAAIGPIVFAKHCRGCGSEFETRNRRHRFCQICLPEWAKQAASSRLAPEPVPVT